MRPNAVTRCRMLLHAVASNGISNDRASWRARFEKFSNYSGKSGCYGGESGIRTRVTVSRKHTFQACAFNHSATSPSLHFSRWPVSPRGLGTMQSLQGGRYAISAPWVPPTSEHLPFAPEPSKQQARGSSSRSRAECQAITAVYSLCRPHTASPSCVAPVFQAATARMMCTAMAVGPAALDFAAAHLSSEAEALRGASSGDVFKQ